MGCLDRLATPEGLNRLREMLRVLGLLYLRPEFGGLAMGQKPAQEGFAGGMAAHQLGAGGGVGFGVIVDGSGHASWRILAFITSHGVGGQVVEPGRGVLQLALAVVLYHGDGVTGLEASDDLLGEAGDQALVAFDDDVHALQGRGLLRVQQVALGAFDATEQQDFLIGVAGEVFGREERPESRPASGPSITTVP